MQPMASSTLITSLDLSSVVSLSVVSFLKINSSSVLLKCTYPFFLTQVCFQSYSLWPKMFSPMFLYLVGLKIALLSALFLNVEKMLFLKQRLCSRCFIIFFSTLLTFGLLISFMIQKELFCNRFSQSLICLMSDASLPFLCIFLKKSGYRMTDLSTNFIKTIAFRRTRFGVVIFNKMRITRRGFTWRGNRGSIPCGVFV